MAKRLVIAEKPSMAEAIMNAVGGKGVKKGHYYDCGNLLITWARGHLVETLTPDKLNPEWKAWRFSTLPMLPTVWKSSARKGAEVMLKGILELVKNKDVVEIVNACDAEREGQLIFDEIMVMAKNKKPCLRFWAQSLTDSAIKAAWAALEPASKRQGMTDASWCRQQADWLVGLNATRAQTLMIQSHANEAGTQNIGRVQTPTLKLLVDRELEIKNFVPKDFFQIFASIQTAPGNYIGRWFRVDDGKHVDRFDNQPDAKAILVKVQGKNGIVKSVTHKDVKEYADALFDLTTLQREANKKHGFTAEKTLEIAQSLYEAKVLTYPRTSSRFLTPDVMSDLVPQALQSAAKGGYAAYVAKIPKPVPTLGKRYVDASKVGDHHAIIPTEIAPGALSTEQQAIYDMVARRLIGAFYPDRIVAESEIITLVEGETFKTKGKVVKQEGWGEVDPSTTRRKPTAKKGEEEEDDDAAGGLPLVKNGEPASLPKGEVRQGKTKPPKQLSEADLLGFMESAGKDVDDEELREAMKESGLGTPATRAKIIEELVKRKFVERRRTNMVPTATGISLIRGIKHPILMSAALTGGWEFKLREMERGKYQRDRFMKEIEVFITQIVGEIRKEANMANDGNGGNGGGGRGEPLALGPCPKAGCGGTVYVRPSKFGARGHYAKCDGDGCKVSYDTDASGDPDSGRCKFTPCEGPVTKTKSGSTICQACDQWQTPKAPGSGPADQKVGECPKCKCDMVLRQWDGAHYVKCSSTAGCKVSYNTDDKGKPKKKCRFAPCKGAVKTVKSTGSEICTTCDKWQEDKTK